ncbi:MAG: serpin family protein [bacterium]
MNTKTLLIALALGFSVACGDSASNDPNVEPSNVVRSEKQRITSPNVSDAQLEQLVDGNTEFAVRLLREIRKTNEGNVIYSPHSISIALAMTYAGARTNTETEMASALNFTLGQSELHPAFNALDLKLSDRGQNAQGSDDQPFRLNIANALWLQDGADFELSFLDTLALNYGAGVNLLDYDADPEAARLEINGWVEDKTEDKIKDLIPEGAITTDTVAVLTNAIYFNASWRDQFEPSMTRDESFAAPTGSISVPMMNQMTTYGYLQGAGFEAVELPYDGDEVSMVILLPDAASDLATLEASLDAATVKSTFEGLEDKLVELSMPKFKFESPIGLNQILKDMGMPSAFDGADFSGISKTMSLAITDVLHKAFIDVNEKGTEAAAATAVIIGETSVPVTDAVVKVDRPFLFAIRDRQTNAVIFMGRVVDPTK